MDLKMKQWIKAAIAVCTSMSFTLLSGCSGASITAKNETVVLDVVTMFAGNDSNAATYHKVNALFMESNPLISINDLSQESSELWKSDVAASFQSGQEPDVLFFFTDANVQNILELDPFVTVEEIQSKYPEYGEYIKEDALQNVTAPDGNIYALPLTGYYEGLFCNVDLFEQYNLELPTTWDNLLTAIQVFDANDIVPIAASLSDIPHYWIEHIILSRGGVEDHMINPKDQVPQSWVSALEYLYTLNSMNAFGKPGQIETNDQANELFTSKQAAMQLEGSWYANGISDKDNTTIVAFPVVPGGQKEPSDIIAGFSSGFYITKKAWQDADKQKAAVDYVMRHTTSASIARYWWGVGTPAANCLNPVGMQRLQDDGAEMASSAKRFDSAIDSRLNPEAWKYLTANIANIANGSMSSQQVLDQVVALNQ